MIESKNEKYSNDSFKVWYEIDKQFWKDWQDGLIELPEHLNSETDLLEEVFKNNKNRIKQKSRIQKYIKRNQYLEAYMKYIDNIAEPLVVISRLIYTPRHYNYKLCHISNHLPKDEVDKLESLFKVSNFNDIEKNLDIADSLLNEYEKLINKKYMN